MQEKDLDLTLDTIESSDNPEIYHARNLVHPGRRWRIKTILPGPKILNDDTHPLFFFWQAIQGRHTHLVRLTSKAYDWKGNLLLDWWTVWCDERIDISWSYSREDGFSFEILDYDNALKQSADKLHDWITEDLDTRHINHLPVSYKKLRIIADFLKTYTSEKQSIKNRLKLRVIENEKMHT